MLDHVYEMKDKLAVFL